jgi:hypothetical protein
LAPILKALAFMIIYAEQVHSWAVRENKSALFVDHSDSRTNVLKDCL